MRTFPLPSVGLAFLALLLGGGFVLASSATFAITGQGIDLGKASEPVGDEPPRYTATAEVGKPFVLRAQGMVLPRDGKPQPGTPEAGAWQFEPKQFKELPAAKTDKTTIGVRLEPTAVGRSRVRFTGTILGYERTFDVLIEVVPAKQ